MNKSKYIFSLTDIQNYNDKIQEPHSIVVISTIYVVLDIRKKTVKPILRQLFLLNSTNLF
jgi:hypothetical protein